MKRVSQLLPNSQQSIGPTKQPKNSERASGVNPDVLEAMTTLWVRMGESHGAAWVNQFGTAGGSAFRTWVLALQDMTAEQIMNGFRKYMQAPDTFRLNAKSFRGLCMPTPEDFGLPEARQAYVEACQMSGAPSSAKWTHPAVYVAGQATGWFELRNMAETKSWPLFQRNYEIAVRRVLAGEDLHAAIPKALPPKSEVKRVTPKAVARQHLADLIASVKGGAGATGAAG